MSVRYSGIGAAEAAEAAVEAVKNVNSKKNVLIIFVILFEV
jgi:hypothetical protein